jgi:hypothetical protein
MRLNVAYFESYLPYIGSVTVFPILFSIIHCPFVSRSYIGSAIPSNEPGISFLNSSLLGHAVAATERNFVSS